MKRILKVDNKFWLVLLLSAALPALAWGQHKTSSAPAPKTLATGGGPPPKEVIVEKPVFHLSVLKAVGFSAIGAGGIGVLGAIMLGISAQDAGDAYNAAPSHAGYVHANALAAWTTGTWVGAGVLLAAGITLVLIPEHSSSAPAKRPEEKNNQTDESPAAKLTLTPSLGGLLLRGTF